MKRHVALVSLLLLTVLLGGCAFFAPGGADVLVQVLDRDGDPLPGASVKSERGLAVLSSATAGYAVVKADAKATSVSATYESVTVSKAIDAKAGVANELSIQLNVLPSFDAALGLTAISTGTAPSGSYVDLKRLTNGNTANSLSNMVGFVVNNKDTQVLQFVFDLGKVERIRQVTALNPYGHSGIPAAGGGRIELSSNGTDWVDAAATFVKDPAESGSRTDTLSVFFPDYSPARYVRVTLIPAGNGWLMMSNVAIRAAAK